MTKESTEVRPREQLLNEIEARITGMQYYEATCSRGTLTVKRRSFGLSVISFWYLGRRPNHLLCGHSVSTSLLLAWRQVEGSARELAADRTMAVV